MFSGIGSPPVDAVPASLVFVGSAMARAISVDLLGCRVVPRYAYRRANRLVFDHLPTQELSDILFQAFGPVTLTQHFHRDPVLGGPIQQSAEQQ